MAYLKNLGTGVVITKYLSLNISEENNLTVQTSLDGTAYLTMFGSPVRKYDLELHVTDSGKELLLAAAASLALMEISVRRGTYTGRITSVSNFQQDYYGWYTVTVTLAADSEVSDA